MFQWKSSHKYKVIIIPRKIDQFNNKKFGRLVEIIMNGRMGESDNGFGGKIIGWMNGWLGF